MIHSLSTWCLFRVRCCMSTRVWKTEMDQASNEPAILRGFRLGWSFLDHIFGTRKGQNLGRATHERGRGPQRCLKDVDEPSISFKFWRFQSLWVRRFDWNIFINFTVFSATYIFGPKSWTIKAFLLNHLALLRNAKPHCFSFLALFKDGSDKPPIGRGWWVKVGPKQL